MSKQLLSYRYEQVLHPPYIVFSKEGNITITEAGIYTIKYWADATVTVTKQRPANVCAAEDAIGWTLEEEEEWNRLLEAIDKECKEKYESTEPRIADRANDGEDSGEEKKEHKGSPKYTPCECGYNGVKVPLASHSDWCGYKKWREWDDKRKEYNDIRIWF